MERLALASAELHRFCHALVAGDEAMEHVEREPCGPDLRVEHAVLRVQAVLADRYGLRAALSVAPEHRAYWDALPDDPLADTHEPDEQVVVRLAIAAWLRGRQAPWRHALHEALAAPAQRARAAGAAAVLPAHPTGFALHRNPGRRCHDCAWHAQLGPGKPASRCRQTLDGPGTRAKRIDPAGRACERWEPRLTDDGASCASCGACCREGFDLVHVRPRERAAKVLRAYVQETAHGLALPRPNGRCVALDGERADAGVHVCRFYADRPRACADFAIGGDACLAARRRVGLSR